MHQETLDRLVAPGPVAPRVSRAGGGVAEKSVPGEVSRPAAGPDPPRSVESAATGPSRGAAPVATPDWSSLHALKILCRPPSEAILAPRAPRHQRPCMLSWSTVCAQSST